MTKSSLHTLTPSIPKSHMRAFITCNNADKWGRKKAFYELKMKILEQYAYMRNYDLQIIEKTCRSCDGTGIHWSGNTCWNCDSGIYQTKKVVLARYRLNGLVFHVPTGNLVNRIDGNFVESIKGLDEFGYPNYNRVPFYGIIINQINGIIRHEPTGNNPDWAYFYLLFNYDSELFYKSVSALIKSHNTRAKHKVMNIFRKYSPLKAVAEFFEIKKPELEAFDDLPF